jgi:hypothetical protein
MTDLATKMLKKCRKQPFPKRHLTAGGPNFGRNKYGALFQPKKANYIPTRFL